MAEIEISKTALSKAMALCAGREQCKKDIRQKLITWDVPGQDADRIIDKLVRENFINEERYAGAYVKDKFTCNRWGKVKITSHLRAKGIPAAVINKALDSIDNETYTKILRNLLSGHSAKIKAKNQYDLKAKLLRFGMSKGFESELLYDMLNDPE
jgi:regulatory protein